MLSLFDPPAGAWAGAGVGVRTGASPGAWVRAGAWAGAWVRVGAGSGATAEQLSQNAQYPHHCCYRRLLLTAHSLHTQTPLTK